MFASLAPHTRRSRQRLRALAAVLSAASVAVAGCGADAPERQTGAAAQPRYVAMAKGRIDVEGGLIRIAASRDGVVREVAVEEGQRVPAQAVLAVLDDREAKLKLAQVMVEAEQARAALAPLTLKLTAAERELKRLGPLVADEAVAREEVDKARDAQALLAAELGATRAAVAAAESRVAVANEEVQQRVVRAPVAGRVMRKLARTGDGVSTLSVTALFLFAPETLRIVRGEFDERYIGVVQPGSRAEVVLEADEARVLPARVLRVAGMVGPRSMPDEPNEKTDQRVIDVVLALDDDGSNALIGQRVLVRVLGGPAAAAPGEAVRR
jgi:HlyD family secretion protein